MHRYYVIYSIDYIKHNRFYIIYTIALNAHAKSFIKSFYHKHFGKYEKSIYILNNLTASRSGLNVCYNVLYRNEWFFAVSTLNKSIVLAVTPSYGFGFSDNNCFSDLPHIRFMSPAASSHRCTTWNTAIPKCIRTYRCIIRHSRRLTN